MPENNRRAEDAERLPAEQLQWEEPGTDIDSIALRAATVIEALPAAADLIGGQMQRKAKVQCAVRDALEQYNPHFHAYPATPAIEAPFADPTALDKLKALAEAANKYSCSPWKMTKGRLRPGFPTIVHSITDDVHNPVIKWTGFDGLTKSKAGVTATARFIAAADPEAILSLIALVSQQAARIAELKKAGSKMANTMYNLAQAEAPTPRAASYKAMQVEWDAAVRATQEGK